MFRCLIYCCTVRCHRGTFPCSEQLPQPNFRWKKEPMIGDFEDQGKRNWSKASRVEQEELRPLTPIWADSSSQEASKITTWPPWPVTCDKQFTSVYIQYIHWITQHRRNWKATSISIVYFSHNTAVLFGKLSKGSYCTVLEQGQDTSPEKSIDQAVWRKTWPWGGWNPHLTANT